MMMVMLVTGAMGASADGRSRRKRKVNNDLLVVVVMISENKDCLKSAVPTSYGDEERLKRGLVKGNCGRGAVVEAIRQCSVGKLALVVLLALVHFAAAAAAGGGRATHSNAKVRRLLIFCY